MAAIDKITFKKIEFVFPNYRSLFTCRNNLYQAPGLFFFLYLPALVVFTTFNFSPAGVPLVFLPIHCLLGFLFFKSVLPYLRRWPLGLKLFWGAVLVLMTLPGAYLEYPADGWEHFQRIYSWRHFAHFQEHPTASRLNYSWAWSLLGHVPIVYRRALLAIYGAFMQGLLTYHFWRFTRAMGVRRGWDLIQTMGFVILFGTNLFSMRYYSLSGTPLALAVYFSFLAELRRSEWTRTINVTLLGACFLLASFNHPQAVLFEGIALILFLAYRYYRSITVKQRQLCRGGLLVFIVTGFALGFAISHRFPEIYLRMEFDRFTQFGSFELWGTNRRYIETIGGHGLLGFLLSPFLLCLWPFSLLLLWMPFFLLLFPPTAFIVTQLFHSDSAYRLFFLFPTSFPLILGVQRGLEFSIRRFNKSIFQKYILGIGTILVLLIASPFQYPWRGRLFFQFYRPPEERTLRFLDQTAAWFEKHPYISDRCRLIADDPTQFIIHSQLGAYSPLYSRINPIRYSSRFPGWTNFLRQAEKDFDGGRRACGILVPDLAQLPNVRPSSIASLSGHWPPLFADLKTHLDPQIMKNLSKLDENKNWHAEEVPPFFRFYTFRPVSSDR